MGQVLSKDGTRIAYETIGQGQALILVDGAMCHRSMRQLASLLSNRFTVCSYDRRGRGESGDTKPYAVQREIEDLEALIDELGGSAHVYGISSGAVLAIKAAGALGGKIQRLAIYEPPFSFGDEAREQSIAYTRQLNERLANDRRGEAVELFMRQEAAEAIAGALPSATLYTLRNQGHNVAAEALAPILSDFFRKAV